MGSVTHAYPIMWSRLSNGSGENSATPYLLWLVQSQLGIWTFD